MKNIRASGGGCGEDKLYHECLYWYVQAEPYVAQDAVSVTGLPRGRELGVAVAVAVVCRRSGSRSV